MCDYPSLGHVCDYLIGLELCPPRGSAECPFLSGSVSFFFFTLANIKSVNKHHEADICEYLHPSILHAFAYELYNDGYI